MKPSRQSSAILHFLVALVISSISFTQPSLLQFQHLSAAQPLLTNGVWTITQNMHAREWLRIEQEKISRPVARGIDVTTKSISTLSLPRLLDYKIEVVIEDLFKTQHDAEEALQAVGTRLEFLIPVTEEAQALSIE